MRWGSLIVGGALLFAGGLVAGVILQRAGAFDRAAPPADSAGRVQPPATQHGSPDPQTPAKSPELLWSREVAEVFLNSSLKAKDLVERKCYGDALAYATEEYRQRLQGGKGGSASDGLCREIYKRIADPDPSDPNDFGRRSYDVYNSWSIDRESLSPERNEAIFRGSLRCSNFPTRLSAFKLYVTKDLKMDRWRVSDFQAEPTSAD